MYITQSTLVILVRFSLSCALLCKMGLFDKEKNCLHKLLMFFRRTLTPQSKTRRLSLRVFSRLVMMHLVLPCAIVSIAVAWSMSHDCRSVEQQLGNWHIVASMFHILNKVYRLRDP